MAADATTEIKFDNVKIELSRAAGDDPNDIILHVVPQMLGRQTAKAFLDLKKASDSLYDFISGYKGRPERTTIALEEDPGDNSYVSVHTTFTDPQNPIRCADEMKSFAEKIRSIVREWSKKNLKEEAHNPDFPVRGGRQV